jgi:organic radical activating enzyme
MKNNPTNKVFISYSHLDKEWINSKLLPLLELNEINISIDNELKYGEDFYEWMQNNLEKCQYFLLVISKAYLENNSWANRELKKIITKSKCEGNTVVPILKDISSTDLPFGLETTTGIYVDKNFDFSIQKLAKQINKTDDFAKNETSYLNKIRRIRIQTSNECPLSCSFCHWDFFEKDVFYNDNISLKILKEISKNDYAKNIQVVLSGGEPLSSPYIDEFIKIAPNKTFLETNALLMDQKIIEVITQSNIKEIRVSYHPQQLSNNQKNTVINNIRNLLIIGSEDLHVRFNHVVTDSNYEISKFIQEIYNTFDRNKKIKGIAFIQVTQHNSKLSTNNLDIFEISKKWAERKSLDIRDDKIARRKIIDNFLGSLRIEFIKINCDIETSNRCLKCIREQDISILLDGRVRICAGLINGQQKSYCLKLLDSNPLEGISKLIRRKYAYIGFFYSFYSFIKPDFVESNKYDEDNIFYFKQYLKTHDIELSLNNNLLLELLRLIFFDSSLFKETYNESLLSEAENDISFNTLEFLIAELHNPKNSIHDQLQILVLISYLTVDFRIFENQKIILVRNILPLLVTMIEMNETEVSIELAAFYLINLGIGLTNCQPDLFNVFIENCNLNPSKPSLLHYIKGLIIRQKSNDSSNEIEKNNLLNDAIKTLKLAETRINECINTFPEHSRIYNEIEVEILRNLGTLYKDKWKINNNDCLLNEKRNEYFQKANESAVKNRTQLRYYSLFSDGYSMLLEYFTKEDNKELRQKAYNSLNESVSLNNDFYASNISLSLIELDKKQFSDAVKFSLNAKRIFQDMALLSDQEYLNFILNELILISALYLSSCKSGKIPSISNLGITRCSNIEKKDIDCVKDNAKFLHTVLTNSHNNDIQIQNIKHAVESFKINCELLKKTNHNKVYNS